MLAMAEIERIERDRQGSDLDSAPPDEWWENIAAVFGVPVEFDAPPQDRRPWITWILFVAIVGSSVLAFQHLQEVTQQFGLIPAQFRRQNGLTFFTSFFLHGGILHLLGNMYSLLVFGDDVENFLRPLRYFALIVVAALVGDLLYIAANPNSQVPCIGASGGIAAIVVFYALNFPRVRLGFLLRWGFYWFRWIRLPAWFGLVLWVLFQIVSGFEQIAGATSVSSLAHLGGGAVGVADGGCGGSATAMAAIGRQIGPLPLDESSCHSSSAVYSSHPANAHGAATICSPGA